MSNTRENIIRLVICALILSAATGFAYWKIKNKKRPVRQPRKAKPELVVVVKAERIDAQVTIHAMGTVLPVREVVLNPEVSGQVDWLSPALEPGAHVKAGTKLVSLDRREYALAKRARVAEVAQAASRVRLEEARAEVALQELELMEMDAEAGSVNRGLVLRQPQKDEATAVHDAAKTALARAELNLERADIKAPFNGQVMEKSVELGQVVSPQTPLLTLSGTDRYWIRISVPVDRLEWINLPTASPSAAGGNGSLQSSRVSVWQRGGRDDGTRIEGRVVRLLGDLERNSRMARVLAEVKDPLGLTRGTDNTRRPVPLLIGATVRIEIAGRELKGIFKIPRTALRDGDNLWLLGEGGTLVIRHCSVVWREQEMVFIDDGLEPGERVIISRLPVPVAGMALREK